jgi:hypothetical protein
MWDETLVFWDVILYGSRDYIKLHPPTILIEVLDKDPVSCCIVYNTSEIKFVATFN